MYTVQSDSSVHCSPSAAVYSQTTVYSQCTARQQCTTTQLCTVSVQVGSSVQLVYSSVQPAYISVNHLLQQCTARQHTAVYTTHLLQQCTDGIQQCTPPTFCNCVQPAYSSVQPAYSIVHQCTARQQCTPITLCSSVQPAYSSVHQPSAAVYSRRAAVYTHHILQQCTAGVQPAYSSVHPPSATVYSQTAVYSRHTAGVHPPTAAVYSQHTTVYTHLLQQYTDARDARRPFLLQREDRLRRPDEDLRPSVLHVLREAVLVDDDAHAVGGAPFTVRRPRRLRDHLVSESSDDDEFVFIVIIFCNNYSWLFVCI